MATAASVWVDVIPSMRGFGPALNKELAGVGTDAGKQVSKDADQAIQKGLTGTGTQAGRSITRSLGSSISRGASSSLTGLNNAFDRTFSWAQAQANGAGGRISTALGHGMLGVLGPIATMRQAFTDAVSGFRSGFRGAGTEATGFARVAQRAGTVVGSTWEAARAPLAGFRLGFRDATGAAGRFSATSRGMAGPVGDAFQRIGGTIGRFRDGFGNASAAASTFSGRAGTAGGVVRRAFDGVSSSVRSVGTQFRTAGEQTASLLAPLGRVGAWAGGAAVAGGLSLIGMAGLSTAMQVEQSTAALGGLYGSGEMANDMLGRMRKLAGTSPIEYTAFLRGAESLAYMGYSGEVAETVLTRVNSALVASGKGAAAMDQVNYAMLEMVNTGKVYAAQLTQMSQAGLPVWSMLADHMGMSIAEVREQVTAGTVEIDTVMAAIQAGGGETFKRMEAAAEKASQTLSSTWARTRDNVTLAFADMLKPMTGGAAAALGATGNAITAGFRALPGLFAQVGTFLRPLIDGFSSIAGPVLGVLVAGFRTVGSILSSVFGPALGWVAGVLRENKVIMAAVGGALAVIATGLVITQGALLAYQGVMLGVRIATSAWAAAQWVLNAAMLNNPIGYLVIAIGALVAGVIYAYNNVDWFRQGVQAAWNGIVSAAQWAWTTVLQPIFGFLTAAVTAVGGFFTWLWTAAIVPAWNGITAATSAAWHGFLKPVLDWIWFGLRFLGAVIFTVYVTPWLLAWQAVSAAAMWAWNAMINPVLGWIRTGLGALGAFFGWVYAALIKPAWDAVGAAIQWGYHTVILPTWNALRAALGAVGSFFQWVWNAVINPTWTALGNGIRWVYQTVILPTWNALRTALGAVGSFFQWVWNAVIKPAWDAFGAGIRWVWENGVRPAFDAMRGGVHAVGVAFDNAVRWIGDVWNRIKSILAKPVNFMINVVYGGVKRTWDTIAGWLRIPGLPHVQGIPENKRGGIIPGYSPGRDTGLSWVSGGEAIMRPEWTDAVGPGWVDKANRIARTRGARGVREMMATGVTDGPIGGPRRMPAVKDGLPAFAAGGHTWPRLWDVMRKQFPFLTKTSDYRPGDPGYHGKGMAVDVATGQPWSQMRRPAQYIASTFPNSTELIHEPGFGIKNGRPFTYSAGTRAAHRNHIHWAMTGAPVPGEGGGGGLFDVVGMVVDWFVNTLMKPVADTAGQFGERFGEGGTSGAMAKVPGAAIDAGVNWVKGLGDRIWDIASNALGSLFGMGGGGGGGAGVERWRGVALQALKMTGQPLGMVDVLLRRMNQESGGNPNAINLWDSNAKKGTPSIGLLQTIQPTFDAYKMPGFNNIRAPLDNILASIRYTISRYGSLPAGYNRPGGYKRGGWLMPGEFAYNETKRPEPILNAEQWDDFRRMSRSGGGAQVTVNAKTDATPDHIAHTVDRHIAMSARL